MEKICPYVQNQSTIEEKYTYTEEGQVETFKQNVLKVNAICIENKCAVWKDGKCNYNN